MGSDLATVPEGGALRNGGEFSPQSWPVFSPEPLPHHASLRATSLVASLEEQMAY